MAAVTTAVNLIKKACSTVDDVRSLGPLLGKYFDAKHTAVKAVKEAKKEGGSNMGKAIEIELALKQQADFEKQLKDMFYYSGNAETWNAIEARVAAMDREDREQERRQRDASIAADKRRKEVIETGIAVMLLSMVVVGTLYGLYELYVYCETAKCAR